MSSALMIIQLFFAVVIGLYFLNLLKSQQTNKVAVDKESKKEMEKLRRMREISLSEPLSEKTRPKDFSEVIGQEDGIKALRAALCGPNPQHVIIYGPPGVGKTAAARLVLEEAKKSHGTPFRKNAKFIEIDATSIRFDERSIADPLIGSVHDPIYQGAGPLGVAGIPQPKPGAVSKAHGGVLFLDEIGELHPIQMNKLLKVLEDRKVFLESAYYNSEDKNIPRHIHDIFNNGLPADFRLIGATTRSREDIPPAIRSRCLEIYFRALKPNEIIKIAENAAKKAGFSIESSALNKIAEYATNGRETVNIIQLAAGLAMTESSKKITIENVEWVLTSGQYNPRPDKKINDTPQVGYVNGLAVYGPNLGTLIEIEASALPSLNQKGQLTVTGVVDEEETNTRNKSFKRKSSVKNSIDNVLTVLRKSFDIDARRYDIHLNFPGGIPIDGPSAGIAITVAIYSAIKNIKIDNKVAMTGELSIRGYVKPIGGINAKLDAAIQAGVEKVIISHENWQNSFKNLPIQVIPVKRIEEVIKHSVADEKIHGKLDKTLPNIDLISASSVNQ